MTAGPATGGLPLLIIGHGTRDATGVAQFRQLIGRVRDQSAGWLPAVDGGFIELSAPSVSEVVPRLAGERLAHGGPAVLVAVPLVLSAAGHGKGDIPAALAREQVRHPGLRYRCYGLLAAGTRCCWTCSRPASMRPWLWKARGVQAGAY